MQMMLANTTSNALTYNATYDDLSRPAQGPVNPFKPAGSTSGLKRKNIPTGFAEEAAISEATFAAQHRTFQSLGYTRNPSAPDQFVGNLNSAAEHAGRDVIQMKPSKEVSAALRAKRQKKGDPSIVEGEGAYLGPWAKYQDDDRVYEEEAALADQELGTDEEFVEEDEELAPAHMPAMSKAATEYQDDASKVETTEFHGSEQFDYLGRTYMHVPRDLDVDLEKEVGSIKNYVPKKLIHTWKSHTKAITSLRFFPNSGHLLLSSAADGKAKIWDVYHSRELLRTFSGHSKAITDTDFHPSGKTFLTASYDRQMKLWDTEYGKCIARFSTGKTPHVLRFNPGATTHTSSWPACPTRRSCSSTRAPASWSRNTTTTWRPSTPSPSSTKPPLHLHLGRQVPARLGVRHPRAHQVHRRALHVRPDARRAPSKR